MSLTPLLLQTNHRKGWTKAEDRALTWAWRLSEPDEVLEEHFGRTMQAIAQRASNLGLGRRGKTPALVTSDEKIKAENAELKGKVEKITTVFDTAIELFKNMNLELKNDL